MLEYINKFEKGVYYVLMVMLAVVIFFTLIELIISLIPAFIPANIIMRLENEEILEIFGYFLLVLIGIELLETIKAYLIKNEIHVEIIVLVAIIAVARKIILLDPFIEGAEALSSTIMIALGVVVIALSASYFLIRKSGIDL